MLTNTIYYIPGQTNSSPALEYTGAVSPSTILYHEFLHLFYQCGVTFDDYWAERNVKVHEYGNAHEEKVIRAEQEYVNDVNFMEYLKETITEFDPQQQGYRNTHSNYFRGNEAFYEVENVNSIKSKDGRNVKGERKINSLKKDNIRHFKKDKTNAPIRNTISCPSFKKK